MIAKALPDPSYLNFSNLVLLLLILGTGYSMLISLFLSQICYVVIFAWVLFYLIASFMNPLPWTTCGNSWNTEDCYARNGSNSNMSGIPPSQEFYE